jgi:acyl phosphate:glycerol-3-phosphate acyltransferase
MINAPAVFGLILVLAYLMGAIPFSVIVTKIKGVDLTKVGSGNLGATNVYRALGLGYALLVFGLDVLKGALPTLLAMHYFPSPIIQVLVALTAIVGHSFSLFLGFKGGKGVATALGALGVIAPQAVGVCFVVAVTIIKFTRKVSLATLTACVLLPVLVWYFGHANVVLYTVSFVSFFIVCMHRSNIARLIKGTENRL